MARFGNSTVRFLVALGCVAFFSLMFFVLLVFAIELTLPVLQKTFNAFPSSPSKKYQTFSNISGTIVALFGVIAALLTFVLSTRSARRAQRKQHTITVLLDTRLSAEFQSTINRRRIMFPEYSDVTFEQWDSARTATATNQMPAVTETPEQQRDSAAALMQLLNYYEFLAVGIKEGDLDEKMLKNTLRGIMCNLVDDTRLLICALRKKNPKLFEHLVALYDDWRRPDATDINDKPNERPIPPLP